MGFNLNGVTSYGLTLWGTFVEHIGVLAFMKQTLIPSYGFHHHEDHMGLIGNIWEHIFLKLILGHFSDFAFYWRWECFI